MHRVRGVDSQRAGTGYSGPRDLDLFLRDWNIQVLCLLEERIADRVFALGAVSTQLGLSLDGVLKLIVREIRRGQHGDQIYGRHNRDDAGNQFKGTHETLRLRSRARSFIATPTANFL